MGRHTPPPITPRRLTAEQAAGYLGYSTTDVLANIPVKPRALCEKGPGSQPKYDLHEIDAWLDQLAGLSLPGGSQGEGVPADDAEAAYKGWKASKRGAG